MLCFIRTRSFILSKRAPFGAESLEFPLAHGGQGAMITAEIILVLGLPPELHISNKT
jgi:hypothetical protein